MGSATEHRQHTYSYVVSAYIAFFFFFLANAVATFGVFLTYPLGSFPGCINSKELLGVAVFWPRLRLAAPGFYLCLEALWI